MRTYALAAGTLALAAALAIAPTARGAEPAAAPKKPAAKPAQSEQKLEKEITLVDAETKKKVTKSLRVDYLLFLPPGCPADAKAAKAAKERWPVILFLHGAGERGKNLSLVKKHGPPKLVEKRRDFRFIVVSPQCPRSQWWDLDALTALLDDVLSRYPADAERVYLTGLSMGGFGTWALAARSPERFAAIVPICGGGLPGKAGRLKDLPTWAFHGGRDRVVRPELSKRMVDAMKAAGAKKVELTIYPDAGHDSWTKTYDNPKLYEWLLKHKRVKAGTEKKGARKARY